MVTDFFAVFFSIGFSLIVLSYYLFLLLPKKQRKKEREYHLITVVIPAHNEEAYIKESILSVLNAKGKKEIIVINDGSKDKTQQIIEQFRGKVTLINLPHSGKAFALNKALTIAKGDLFAVVDGDSCIPENALVELADTLCREKVGAVTCPVRVKNRKKFLCMWMHIAELYNSLVRELLTKVNANITTPGPLSMYRTNILRKLGGFSTDVLSEDADIAIRIIRSGYHIEFNANTYSETNMPHQFKWFFLQRLRFARGLVKILKKHMQANTLFIDLYTLPIQLFNYLQAVVMGFINIYQIFGGYIKYFYLQGTIFNFAVVKFFFEWFSIIGFFKWSFQVFTGTAPLNLLSATAIFSTLMSYPLFLMAIIKYDKKIDLWHIIPFVFMFPFWFFLMIVQILSLPEMLRKHQRNFWYKND